MGTALNSFTPKGVEHGTATGERSDVQPPRQGKDKPRLSDAAAEKRDPRHDSREHQWDWLAMTAFERDRNDG